MNNYFCSKICDVICTLCTLCVSWKFLIWLKVQLLELLSVSQRSHHQIVSAWIDRAWYRSKKLYNITAKLNSTAQVSGSWSSARLLSLGHLNRTLIWLASGPGVEMISSAVGLNSYSSSISTHTRPSAVKTCLWLHCRLLRCSTDMSVASGCWITGGRVVVSGSVVNQADLEPEGHSLALTRTVSDVKFLVNP